MSDPAKNGSPEELPEGGFCNDNVVHFVWSDGDPDATVEYWPNCGPSQSAWPPKSDQVPETPHDELIALVNAMTTYKRKRGLQYLLWEDVLDVLHDMGYRKVASPSAAAPEAAPAGDGAAS
jgi:hypothetical protein